MFEVMDSQEELQQALQDPESFLNRLLSKAGGAVGSDLLISKLKPQAEPVLQK